jgi:hypothetical protein
MTMRSGLICLQEEEYSLINLCQQPRLSVKTFFLRLESPLPIFELVDAWHFCFWWWRPGADLVKKFQIRVASLL